MHAASYSLENTIVENTIVEEGNGEGTALSSLEISRELST